MGWDNQRRQHKIYKMHEGLASLPVFQVETATRWILSVSLLVQAYHPWGFREADDDLKKATTREKNAIQRYEHL